jgi:hypothetical protein
LGLRRSRPGSSHINRAQESSFAQRYGENAFDGIHGQVSFSSSPFLTADLCHAERTSENYRARRTQHRHDGPLQEAFTRVICQGCHLPLHRPSRDRYFEEPHTEDLYRGVTELVMKIAWDARSDEHDPYGELIISTLQYEISRPSFADEVMDHVRSLLHHHDEDKPAGYRNFVEQLNGGHPWRPFAEVKGWQENATPKPGTPDEEPDKEPDEGGHSREQMLQLQSWLDAIEHHHIDDAYRGRRRQSQPSHRDLRRRNFHDGSDRGHAPSVSSSGDRDDSGKPAKSGISAKHVKFALPQDGDDDTSSARSSVRSGRPNLIARDSTKSEFSNTLDGWAASGGLSRRRIALDMSEGRAFLNPIDHTETQDPSSADMTEDSEQSTLPELAGERDATGTAAPRPGVTPTQASSWGQPTQPISGQDVDNHFSLSGRRRGADSRLARIKYAVSRLLPPRFDAGRS